MYNLNLATYRQLENAAWDWIIKKSLGYQFLFLQQKM